MTDLEKLFRKASADPALRNEYRTAVRDLRKVLKISENLTNLSGREVAHIVELGLGRAAGHSIVNFGRHFGLSDEITYQEALRSCAKEYLDIGRPPLNPEKCEIRIIKAVFQETWEKLSEKQREALRKSIREEARSRGENAEDLIKKISAGMPLNALMAAKLAGFSTYILATSSLAFVAELTGLSIGFGAYTGLTQAIAVVLGPVGLTLSVLFGAYQIGRPAYASKVLPCILIIAALRQRISITKRRNRS